MFSGTGIPDFAELLERNHGLQSDITVKSEWIQRRSRLLKPSRGGQKIRQNSYSVGLESRGHSKDLILSSGRIAPALLRDREQAGSRPLLSGLSSRTSRFRGLASAA